MAKHVADTSGERSYDIVLFGATGFTGGLTAHYLAEHAPEGCRWALAGRNLVKLEEVRASLGSSNLGSGMADNTSGRLAGRSRPFRCVGYSASMIR